MDYGESSEFGDEGLNIEDEDGWEDIPLEFDDEPSLTTVVVQFKSGLSKEWRFMLPKTSDAYDGPITKDAFMHIITNAYSYGEAPFVVLPLDDGSHVFLDLNATDFVEVR